MEKNQRKINRYIPPVEVFFHLKIFDELHQNIVKQTNFFQKKFKK